MAKIVTLNAKIIDRLIEDYNAYSEGAAINRMDGNNADWNRGQQYLAKEYLDIMCDITGTTLVYEMAHRTLTTGQEIEYLTVRRQR